MSFNFHFIFLEHNKGRQIVIFSPMKDENSLLYRLEAAEKHACELEKKHKERVNFCAQTAHEVRNRLAIILAHCRTLARQEEPTKELQVKHLGEVIAATEKVNNLINELLDSFQKENQLDRPPKIVKGNLVETIRGVCRELAPLWQEKDITFQYWHSGELSEVFFDQEKIACALRNLLQNAVKFSPEKSRICLAVETREDEGGHRHLELSVIDRGIGVPEGELPHIFTRFVRGSHTRDHFPGTGIGLATVRSIALEHRGEVRAKNNVGGGATFTIILPLKPPPKTPYRRLGVILEEKGYITPTQLEEALAEQQGYLPPPSHSFGQEGLQIGS